MLEAFEHIHLLIMPAERGTETQELCFVTPLSPVQERILTLLGLPTSSYTSLQFGDDGPRLRQKKAMNGQANNLPDPTLTNWTTNDQNDAQLQLA